MQNIRYKDISNLRQAILDLVGNAPESADTLGELHDLISNLPSTTRSFDALEQNVFSFNETRTYYPSGDYKADKLHTKTVGNSIFTYNYAQRTVSDETKVVGTSVSLSFPVITKSFVYSSGSFAIEAVNYSNINDLSIATVLNNEIILASATQHGLMSIADKNKLDNLEDLFLGQYTSLASLQEAHPLPSVGSYAFIDMGLGEDVKTYLWDSSDNTYVMQLSDTPNLTSSQVKELYESNADTNVFTDGNRNLLLEEATLLLGRFQVSYRADLLGNIHINPTSLYINRHDIYNTPIPASLYPIGTILYLGNYLVKVTSVDRTEILNYASIDITVLDATATTPALDTQLNLSKKTTPPTRRELEASKQNNLSVGDNLSLANNALNITGILPNSKIPLLDDSKVPDSITRDAELNSALLLKQNALTAGTGINLIDNVISSNAEGFKHQLFLTSGNWDWVAAGSPEIMFIYLVGGGGGGGSANTVNKHDGQNGGFSSFSTGRDFMYAPGGVGDSDGRGGNAGVGSSGNKGAMLSSAVLDGIHPVYANGGGAGYSGGGSSGILATASLTLANTGLSGGRGGGGGNSNPRGGSGGVLSNLYYFSPTQGGLYTPNANMYIIVGQGGRGGGAGGGLGGVHGSIGQNGYNYGGGGGGSGAVLLIWQ